MWTNGPPPNTACLHIIITSSLWQIVLLLITFTTAKIEKACGWCHKNFFCAPAAIPASLLTLNMNKNEDKHQQTGPLTLQKEYPGLAAHSVPTSSSTMHHFCWHKEIFIRAVHPKTGRMFTLKTQVIKIEFYCVQVKDKNLERQTQTFNMTDRAK